MKRCVTCLMPETARNIGFNEDGECLACTRAKAPVNRKARMQEFVELCDMHRKTDGSYDCIVPVSGGKDSMFQLYHLVEEQGMNPLLLSVTDSWRHTKAGEFNAVNIAEAFNCDCYTLRLNPRMVRRTTRFGFEQIGSTNWAVDKAIYAWPLKMAAKLGIPLVVYGENVEWEYGCRTGKDTPSAKDQIKNNVVNVDWKPPHTDSYELAALQYPTEEEIDKLEPVYLSYYTGWDGLKNLDVANCYGFKSLQGEWERRGYIDFFWQVDSIGYLMNYFLKYAKYGYSKATDVASHLIRHGYMSRTSAAQMVARTEGELDEKVLEDFLRLTEYQPVEFWTIMRKWFNKDLFEFKGELTIPRLKAEHEL